MQWEQIKGNARQVAVTDIRDVVVWGLTANNFFLQSRYIKTWRETFLMRTTNGFGRKNFL
jgi:hypothetical protein